MRQGSGPAALRWSAALCVLLLVRSAAWGDEVHVRRRAAPRDNQYCGIDSLYVFLKVEGVCPHSLAEMEKELPPTPRGIAVHDMAHYCERNGVSVSVVNASLARLTEAHLPAVLLVNGDHFVTLVGTDEDRLLLFDNAYGLADCTPEWFAQRYRWDGVAIVHGSAMLDVFVSHSAAAGWLLAAALAAAAFFLTRRRSTGNSRTDHTAPSDAPSSGANSEAG